MARSIPIITLANLKGGVGKTTLAANLAAWFDAQGERVLLIDLDHQGSLSAMALGGDVRGRDLAEPGARRVLAGDWPMTLTMAGAQSNSQLIDAANVVQSDETRILFQWMLGLAPDDVRYRLAGLLLNPRIQTTFDRVIIDTPPRVTLGFVNALCASTHLLVPTQLNGLSVEAVQSFLATLDSMRPVPLPPSQQYRILGVQKTWATGRLNQPEREAIARVERMLSDRGEPPTLMLTEAMVPNMSAFARAAGHAIAWCTEPSVRPEIERLGRAVAAFAPSVAEAPE
jgi:chromosome partitioning protein